MSSEAADESPRIAILGAGPVGLEAALYGRYLGYQVAVFERRLVAQHVRDWGHVRMFSPFKMNRSLLGLAALQAQQFDDLPGDDELLTGTEYVDRYLLPLSRSDLLANCVHEGVEVFAVGRDGVVKSDTDPATRAECPFRLLLLHEGQEEVADADYVLDCSGVYATPKWMGHGGIPAIGEQQLGGQIERHVPDVNGALRDRYAGRHVLVVGNGYSAATTVVALHELAKEVENTRVTWVTRRRADSGGPIPRREQDPLSARDQLAETANRLVLNPDTSIELLDQTTVVEVTRVSDAGGFQVQLSGRVDCQLVVDEIVANVGYRPDLSAVCELQFDLCPATEALRGLGAWLTEHDSADTVDTRPPSDEALAQPEPNFFVLGNKAFGRDSNFLLRTGLEQIRSVYSVIAARAELDLYQTMEGLVQR